MIELKFEVIDFLFFWLINNIYFNNELKASVYKEYSRKIFYCLGCGSTEPMLLIGLIEVKVYFFQLQLI
jgi:hypothetical protein